MYAFITVVLGIYVAIGLFCFTVVYFKQIMLGLTALFIAAVVYVNIPSDATPYVADDYSSFSEKDE